MDRAGTARGRSQRAVLAALSELWQGHPGKVVSAAYVRIPREGQIGPDHALDSGDGLSVSAEAAGPLAQSFTHGTREGRPDGAFKGNPPPPECHGAEPSV